MNKIEVGKTYRTAAGDYTCIHIEGDTAWMISHAAATAYVWTVEGTSLSFGENYNVVWHDKPRKTITRTITYPAPETKAPAIGTEYFVPELINGYSLGYTWYGIGADLRYLQQGLVYLTEDDAIARAKVMLE